MVFSHRSLLIDKVNLVLHSGLRWSLWSMYFRISVNEVFSELQDEFMSSITNDIAMKEMLVNIIKQMEEVLTCKFTFLYHTGIIRNKVSWISCSIVKSWFSVFQMYRVSTKFHISNNMHSFCEESKNANTFCETIVSITFTRLVHHYDKLYMY